MSHIFDALQRSEAERSGGKASSTFVATELLELAEREAAAKWDSSETVVEPRRRPTPLEHELPFGMDLSAPEETIAEIPASPQLAPAEEAAEFFRDCQTLQLSITPQNRLVSLADGDSPATEAFRLLSVRLRHLRRDRQLQKLLITSSIPQEGKSVVSANVTCALASATRQKVLLVEGDVRRPSLSKVFGLKPYPGICECLEGKRSLAASIYRLEPAGVWFFPAGAAPANPLELLEGGRLPVLIEQLAGWFDWIIIDSPPILPLADTSVWTRLADGILLVTRQGTTQKRHLQRGLEALESKKVIGAVLNSSKSSADNDYYAYRRPVDGSAAQ
ncbi:MAG TPA: CpsD/CapB family tyrosine-protein kinase [Terracidiphilus sp.]|jgi:capsular exopolysaccharide synthesis family protein